MNFCFRFYANLSQLAHASNTIIPFNAITSFSPKRIRLYFTYKQDQKHLTNEAKVPSYNYSQLSSRSYFRSAFSLCPAAQALEI